MHPSDVPADVGKILDDTLKTFQDEYKDRLDTWRVIEGKAQTVLTTSGAFLGGLITNAHVINMKRDTAELWRQCVESLQTANAAKARLVCRGQVLIGLGSLIYQSGRMRNRAPRGGR